MKKYYSFLNQIILFILIIYFNKSDIYNYINLLKLLDKYFIPLFCI